MWFCGEKTILQINAEAVLSISREQETSSLTFANEHSYTDPLNQIFILCLFTGNGIFKRHPRSEEIIYLDAQVNDFLRSRVSLT